MNYECPFPEILERERMLDHLIAAQKPEFSGFVVKADVGFVSDLERPVLEVRVQREVDNSSYILRSQ